MAYEKQEWKGLPDTSTPVTPERLDHIEEGIYQNSIEAEQKDIITISISSNKTVTAASRFSRTKLPFDQINSQIGNNLTFVDNGIKIGKGISKILIGSGCDTFGNDKSFGLYIQKNDEYIGIALFSPSNAGHTSINIANKLVDVQENDLITLNVYLNEINDSKEFYSYNGNATFMTVQAIEYQSEN